MDVQFIVDDLHMQLLRDVSFVLYLICNTSLTVISNSLLLESITEKVLHEKLDLHASYDDKCSWAAESKVTFHVP